MVFQFVRCNTNEEIYSRNNLQIYSLQKPRKCQPWLRSSCMGVKNEQSQVFQKELKDFPYCLNLKNISVINALKKKGGRKGHKNHWPSNTLK